MKLLAARPDFRIDVGCDERSWTPLLCAAMRGRKLAVEFLLTFYPPAMIKQAHFGPAAAQMADDELHTDIAAMINDYVDTH